MKTGFLTTIILLTSLSLLKGQTVFKRTYGGSGYDDGHSVQQTADGGYILFGQTRSFGNGFQDMYLVKTDNNGIEQWSRTYGGADWEFGNSVQQTSDGGYILCGSYSGTINDSLALIKTDSVGNVIWNKRYSGSIDREVGQFVRETTDGGFIAVGFTGPSGTEDIYLLKTDKNGTELWNRVYFSSGKESAHGVRQTGDGGYIISGETDSKGKGGNDMYLIKTNSSGDTTWTKTYGTASNETGWSLYITSDGGYALLGYENFAGGNLFLVKTDALGNEQWHKYYGGTYADEGYSVQQTSDGGYVLAGSKGNSLTSDEMYCIKTDNAGTVQWEYTYPKGLTSFASSVQQTTDGGYILLGSTYASGNTDMYLVKIASNGVLSVFDNNDNPIKFTTYPNPFNEHTTIELGNSKNAEFRLMVFNMQGQVVKTIDHISGKQVKVEKEDLVNGMYFFQVLSENTIVGTGKFVLSE